jgi:endogenous inhibitor of DNA gyrase (YacG/DUF329 family)
MPETVRPCAYCRQHAAVAETFPFCSERCKMADLGRWLTGGYRIASDPHEPLDSQDDEAEQDPDSNKRDS